MSETAAFQGPGIFRSRSFWIALFISLPLLFAGFCESASAKRHPLVGADGKIHACYRVKGKPKGALRAVRSRKVRCRRGERKVAWAVAAVAGPAGADGARGTVGSQGDSGTQSTLVSKLTEQIDSLSSRVGTLESTLEGVTNTELDAVIDSLPAIESLCKQSEDLTEQVNLVADVVEGLDLNNALTILGGLIEIPPLPTELKSFSCSTP
jgi:hypothetical protein